MTRSRKHRRKDAFDGNDLVSIRVDVLKDALENRGWRPIDQAASIGDSQQTISALVHTTRPDRRCRRQRARNIAKALEIPFEQLTGGLAVAPWTPLVWEGFEFRYSGRTELAASRLLTKCLDAVKRDMELGESDLRPGTRSYFAGVSLVGLVAELLQVGRWRQWLLEWDQDVIAQRGYTEPASDTWEWDPVRDPPPDPTIFQHGMYGIELIRKNKPRDDPVHEEAILSLARAIEHVLTPWFEGEAKLNYEALQRLTYLPQPYPAQDRVDSFSPFAAVPQPTESSRNIRTERSTRRKK